MALLTERYADKILGQLSYYDRIVIQGTLPGFCFADGMTSYLYANNIHIFSAMEACPSYKPWHNKKTHRTYLKPSQGKCLHYYFYFIDEKLGLCYVRVPKWCPFRLQIYFNGHGWLGSELPKRNIDCPVIGKFNLRYHWSIMQAEYATDIVFKRQQALQAIYDQLTRTAIHVVKPENVATFPGKKLHGNYQDEMGNNFNTRIEGTRIKHTMGQVAIKMYDKLGLVLRIETTANNGSFFKHYRKVEHGDGSRSLKLASVKRGIYSLSPLTKLLCAANGRYLEFICLKRLRTHGLIKKIGHTYKYYLTKIGRKVVISGLKLKELFLIPELATN